MILQKMPNRVAKAAFLSLNRARFVVRLGMFGSVVRHVLQAQN